MMLRRFSAIVSKTGKRAGRAALACILCLAALAGSFVAVSYTHLDVYKRQAALFERPRKALHGGA